MSAYLDLSTLEPIDPPNSRSFADYYESNGQPQIMRFNSPAGIVTATLGPDGKPTGFMMGDPEGGMATFAADGTYSGSFMPGKGDFWDDFKGNVLEDDKFMTFLAIVAAGAAAGSYAGGAGAAEGAGAAGATEGAGTASMSAGDLAAMDAAGGAQAGTGALAEGTAGMSAGDLAAMDAAGGAQAGTGVGGGAPISAATPSSYGAGGAGGAGVSGGSTVPASGWWDSVLNFAGSRGGQQVIGGIISGIGQGYLAERNNQAADDRARAQRDWASAEADKERAYKARNMNLANMPRIVWTPTSTRSRGSEQRPTTAPLTDPQGVINGVISGR